MKNIIIILLFLIVDISYSQVYDYLPIDFSNIETNPTFVASQKNKFTTSLTHINNFQDNNKFSMNSLILSRYFDNLFSGIGLIFTVR